MRGAIVGFGTIAMGHLVGYSRVDEASIVAAADPSVGRRDEAARAGLRGYADVDTMLDHEDLDFIDICAPPNTHVDYIRLGLARGMHVLCEKPVLLPEDDGYERVMKEVWAADRLMYPCHVYKFSPILDLMHKIVTSPDFGDVVDAQFRTFRKGHAVGVPEWRPHWRRDRAVSGGGILRDHGPHSVYLATNLTGRTPVAVSCLLGNMRAGEYEDTEDTAILRVRCDDDVQITLTLSWSACYRNTSYSITGSAATVVVEDDHLLTTLGGKVDRTVMASGFNDPSHQDWFGRMLSDFVDMVARPERQDALIHEMLMTSMVIDGAYQSAAARGEWVDVRVPDRLVRPTN